MLAIRCRNARVASSVSGSSSSSSRRVALATRSIAGKIRRSASSRLSTSSLLPVPLNSSKITWSILLPVSTSAVAMMVSDPPPCAGSTLRALPRKRFGFSSDCASSPPDSVRPVPFSTVL